MPKRIKIILAVVFVLAVAFFAAKSLIKPGKRSVSPPAGISRTVKIAPKIQPAPAKARMAIILDDWGHSTVLLDDVAAIGRPLTLSILPNLEHSRVIAEFAKSRGLGVMLHMPMQPEGKNQPLEAHTILISMSEDEIHKYLDEALASVPYVAGVNNHQGSAATSDERVMRAVLAHLKKKGLFFVDSLVVSTSVGARVAREAGIRFLKRDVFIDNRPVVDAIMESLKQAQQVALKRGKVVVIGHDKHATVEAIKRMDPDLEKNGVKLVLVKEFVE